MYVRSDTAAYPLLCQLALSVIILVHYDMKSISSKYIYKFLKYWRLVDIYICIVCIYETIGESFSLPLFQLFYFVFRSFNIFFSLIPHSLYLRSFSVLTLSPLTLYLSFSTFALCHSIYCISHCLYLSLSVYPSIYLFFLFVSLVSLPLSSLSPIPSVSNFCPCLFHELSSMLSAYQHKIISTSKEYLIYNFLL